MDTTDVSNKRARVAEVERLLECEMTAKRRHELEIICANLKGWLQCYDEMKPKAKPRCPHRFIDRTKCVKCDPAGFLKHEVSLNTWHAIKNDGLAKLDEDGNIPYVCCTPDELRAHLVLPKGKTWNDWNIDSFHIDHIVAVKKYEPIPMEVTIARLHWTNLQILSAKENRKKGNR